MRKELVKNMQQMLDQIESKNPEPFQIVDARPSGRFNGTDPEPRPNLESGHMPGALNVPFLNLFT